MMAERRRKTKDDLITWVINASFEGQKLDEWEIGSFFSLLGSAANDTTRHSIAHAIRLLFAESRPEGPAPRGPRGPGRLAAEDVIRFASRSCISAVPPPRTWSSATTRSRRASTWSCGTARPTRSEVFDDPGTFNILRSPNDHCRFRRRWPALLPRQRVGPADAAVGDHRNLHAHTGYHPDQRADFQVNNFIHGVHSLPVRWDATHHTLTHHFRRRERTCRTTQRRRDLQVPRGRLPRRQRPPTFGPKLMAADLDLQVYYSDPDACMTVGCASPVSRWRRRPTTPTPTSSST